LAFATKTGASFSRAVNLGWFAGTAVAFVPFRIATRLLLGSMRAAGRNTRNAVIIGATELGLAATRELSEPTNGMRLLGFYDGRSTNRVKSFLGGFEMLGSVDQAIEDARQGRIDYAYIALPMRAQKRIAKIVAAFADTTVNVQLLTDFTTFDLLHARWGQLGEIPTVSVYDSPFHGAAGTLKRIEDIIVGSLILLIATPVMLLVALAVKISSRYGLNGRPIRVIKFRSMTTMEDAGNVVQATQGDARITRVGAFLRKTSLDELPQFINVLRGEMSIVGPRPHAVAHNEQYRSLIHGYMLRHKVKPGITGWAQINGCRGETETIEKMRERVRYDLEYIEKWNMSWDIEIILRTAFKAWNDRNAY
jgi:putative colanic acid biosynthesis UDP-glucose lipid carrier transferase